MNSQKSNFKFDLKRKVIEYTESTYFFFTHNSSFWLILSIIGVIITVFGMVYSFQETRQKKEPSTIFTKQIENLDAMSKNLAGFQKFIAEQKKNAIAEKSALIELKQEKELLKQLVESDRKIVQALFIQQEKRQREKVWYERAFGFFTGILSSIIAGIILYKVTKKKAV